MNTKNKEIWDNIFSQQSTISNDVMCEDENGNYVPATPIGFDDEQKTFDALKDIIEGAIKNKTYKTWKMRSELFETYSDEHLPIEEFDVIFCFSADWEEALFPVLVKEIKEDAVVVMWLGGRDNEEAKTQEISYKK